jgi:methionyl-tRNA synthetase
MREMVLGQDANFSEELFIKRYNSDLANDLGNLVSRVTKLISKFYDSRIPKFVNKDSVLKEKYLNIILEKRIENFEIHTLLKEVSDFIQSINIFLEENAPWKQAKSDLELAGDTLYHSIEAIRVSTKILEPVMPRKCNEILQILSSEDLGLEWGSLQPDTLIREQVVVFPRIVD